MMKRISVLLLIYVTFLSGCASSSPLIFDYNMDADFEAYGTYVLCSDDFMVVNENHPNIDNEVVRQKIGSAIADAMEARGHKTNVFEPELQAGFRIAVSEKTAKFNNCEHSKELFYWESCSIHEETYNEETLITYVADFKSNQVLWQASIPCQLNKSDKKLEAYISALVQQLFETYPKDVNLY